MRPNSAAVGRAERYRNQNSDMRDRLRPPWISNTFFTRKCPKP